MMKKNIESSEEGKQIWWNLQYACQEINSYHNRNGFENFPLLVTYSTSTLRIGECPSNSPFLKNNAIVFKEWRDTRTFSNLKSTHGTFLILLIINLVTKKSLCVVSKVQREQ